MCILMRPALLILGSLIGLTASLTQAQDGILNAVPSDAIGFAVVHNLADASRSIDEVAKLVKAPVPDLVQLAKNFTGTQKGLNEQGDLAIVLTTIDPSPKAVVLVPVSNNADFFTALHVKEPGSGIVEAQLAGKPALVGQKGKFAVLAMSTDRDALTQFLESTTNLATDAQLTKWLDENKVSIVLTTNGIKQLLPKLTKGIRAIQTQLRQAPGVNGSSAAAALNMYADLFSAAESEAQQFGLGLRIDSAQTVELIKRVQFTPEGEWTKWAANANANSTDLLAGLPAGPFVAAIGGVVPHGAMEQLMKFSVQMMQNQPQFKLTPEQAQKYVGLSMGMMTGVHAMRMVLGVPDPGTGLYSKMLAVITVDDSKNFMERYEKSLAGMREFIEETTTSTIPVATTKRVTLGETEVLEVSTNISKMNKLAPAGGPDSQKMMELMFGPGDELQVYVAPADEHTVVMAYTSIERLKDALEFYKAKKPGLSEDAGVAKVAAALPPGSQLVAYAKLSGIADVVRQLSPAIPGARPAAIPEFSESPPLGMAVKVSPTGAEGYLVVTAETLGAIGDAVAKARNPAAPSGTPKK